MKYLIKVYPEMDNSISAAEICEYQENIKRILKDKFNYDITSYKCYLKEDLSYPFVLFIIDYEKEVSSIDIFNSLNEFYPLVMVTVIDKRFVAKDDKEVYWTNGGDTTYHDGSTYRDPYYNFHFMGYDDYDIIYVPYYIRNMYDNDKRRYDGMTYMWRCTGSWDNPLKATTIEEAIVEFEDYYKNTLWKCVEVSQERLADNIKNYKNFNDYLEGKNE